MNEKKTKALRKAMVPGRGTTGMSRGAFVRLLTKYNRLVRKRVLCRDVYDKDGEQVVLDYYTQTLDPECPRGKLQAIKRGVR